MLRVAGLLALFIGAIIFWAATAFAQSNSIEGEAIIQFENGLTAGQKSQVLEKIGSTLILDNDPVNSPYDVIKIPNTEKAIKILEKHPLVKYAEPNYIVNIAWTPNDRYYTNHQHGPQVTETDLAWDVAKGQSSQSIAVIDTGVDYNHPDLDGKTIKGYDFVQNDWNPMDQNNHGTHVAGIAAAETNNLEGIAGMAPASSILAVRVLDARGSGSLSDVADGIYYAVDSGAEVLNLSLGCDCSTQTLEEAVNYAWNKGAVVVAAAGNSDVSTTFEPASYEPVIAVAATDKYDQKAPFSNYGSWVDVTAPGVDIVSTVRRGSYSYMSGTSMASPHVAGLAGILAGQGKTNVEIRKAIEGSADPVNGTDVYWSHGRINSYKAVTTK